MVYLDNAATSFPKPQETIESLNRFVTSVGGNPGRSGHPLSIEAARIVFDAREKLAALIGGTASERLIFTRNGTESLNLATLGLVKEGDHVVTTSLEHNSVMRPLDFLAKTRGVEVSVITCSEKGELDLDRLKGAMRKTTRLVIVNHGSNVIGSVQPIAEIRSAIGDVPLVLDACQTVGSVPIDVEAQGIDVLCFSCHKSLFGIQGLGAVYLGPGIEPRPLTFGGTGSRSEFTEQPDMLPDRYESGTQNTPGIAALLGGLTFIEKVGLEQIRKKERGLRRRLISDLSALDRVTVHGDPLDDDALPVVSITMQGLSSSDIGYECSRGGVCVRVGLQCSPLAHRTIGTFPEGTVRISPGYFTTDEDIGRLMEVIEGLARR
jgi:cysteine desulfurase family protein